MFGSVIQRGDFTGKGEKRKSRKSTIFGVCAVGCDKTLCDQADSHPAQSCVRTVPGGRMHGSVNYFQDQNLFVVLIVIALRVNFDGPFE